MIKKEFVCISCPLGCQLSVTKKNNGQIIVKGNNCPNGIKYAKEEMSNPKRILTTTVKTTFKDKIRISVKTDKEIPISLIFKAMIEINKTIVSKRIQIGDIVIENILNTGVNVVATTSL